MRKAKVLAAFYAGVLAISVVAVNLGWPEGPVRLPDVDLVASLQAFEACDDALAYFTAGAAEQAAAWQRGGEQFATDQAAEESAGARVAAPMPAADDADGAALGGGDFSTTNVQERGVDEPDLVKTDGRRIVTVAGGRLSVLDATGPTPALAGSLTLPGESWGQELLLDGDRALVFSHGWTDQPIADELRTLPAGTARSVLTLVDLTQDSSPRVASTLTLDGEYVSARMIDGVARVVLRSHPAGPVLDGPMPAPMPMDEPAVGDRAAAAGSAPSAGAAAPAAPAAPTIADWVPHYRLEGDGDTSADQLVPCERIHHPAEFAGLGMVSVVSVDLAGDLTPGAAASVVADAHAVYASTDNLYVAFTSWEAGESTEIHAFDITDPAAATYTASGSVPGRLLNQWALSEHAGHLRVATTEGDSWAGPVDDVMVDIDEPAVLIDPGPDAPVGSVARPAPAPIPSQSAVTVLEARGDELAQVGRVEGLGPTERIYSVRFMGDVGYVVTFRETDPLYTLDLSDPADPRVLGELKILGYSAYLHPLGEGFLLGVGQDATEQGQRLGTQLSLFDVRDLANPTRIHQATIAGGNSAVEHDHRAFLHWPATGTIVLPLEVYPMDRPAVTGADVFNGAVAFTVDPGAGFAELGRLSHAGHLSEPWMGAIQRSLVIGGTLYTVSEAGIGAADLTTLAERAWVPLG